MTMAGSGRGRRAAPPPPVPAETGHNSAFNAEQLDIIRGETKNIVLLEGKRDAINADINAARKKIKAAGFNLDAWRAQKTRQEMDPEKRADFDRSAVACAEALGVPLQGNLFDESDGDAGDLPGADGETMQ